MIRNLLALSGFFFGAMPASAQQATAFFETLEGTVRQVPVAELKGDALGDAAFLRLAGLEALGALEAAQVCELELLGGDLLRGQVEGLDEERLGLGLAGGTRLTIGVDDLLALRFPGRMREGEPAPARPESGDRLYRLLPRGVDRVDGLLIGFSPEGIQFEGRVGERTYAWGDVVALFVEPLEEPAALDSKDATPVRVNLNDGGHFQANYQSIGPDGVRLHNGSEEILLPLELISELLVLNDRYALLAWQAVDSDAVLAPFDEPGGEPLGMVWKHQIDRSVGRQVLRVGGQVWSRGIGVHAPSRLTWKLDGQWSHLRTQAGLQDQARVPRIKGSVHFRILVDGKVLYTSPLARSGDAALVLPDVPLAGAQELVLEVDDGGDGPVMDRANWLRPMLLR